MSDKTASQKKLRANRLNAKKSTGPRTPEGKKRSSRNAIKHGLLAQHIVVDDGDPNDQPADFDRLLDQLMTDFAPQTTVEQLLVERIAASYWRLRRAFRFEAQAIRDRRQQANDPTARIIRQFTGATHDPNKYVLPAEADLNKLVRYESMIDRELNRAMNHLLRLQRDRSTIPPSQQGTDGGSHPIPPSQGGTQRRSHPIPPFQGGIQGGSSPPTPSPPNPGPRTSAPRSHSSPRTKTPAPNEPNPTTPPRRGAALPSPLPSKTCRHSHPCRQPRAGAGCLLGRNRHNSRPVASGWWGSVPPVSSGLDP